MAEEMMKVNMHEDGEHLWIKGKQFVSLERFAEVKKCGAEELRLSEQKVKELTEENEALKVLLKKELNKQN